MYIGQEHLQKHKRMENNIAFCNQESKLNFGSIHFSDIEFTLVICPYIIQGFSTGASHENLQIINTEIMSHNSYFIIRMKENNTPPRFVRK